MLLRSVVRHVHLTPRRCGSEMLSAYSATGKWSVFAMRQRYTILLKNQTDPTIADYYFENFLHAWTRDAPSFQFVWLTMTAMGLMTAYLLRHIFWNPDIYFRRQEYKKPMPDRHRQWSYSLPYYNSRLRNISTKYAWAFVDNEWDFNRIHPLGYRPNRGD